MTYQFKSYKKFMATATTATLVATAVAPVAMAAGFVDVSPKYQEAVDFVVSKGAKGVSETEFGVHENIKRVDAAVLLVNVLGLDYENAAPSGFTDVPERAVQHVNALKEAGITNGKTATTFDSHSLITRGELAVWIQKGFKLVGENEVSFTDVSKRYEEAVSALVDKGVTNGISKTEFGTSQNAKRGDYAIFLLRAHKTSTESAVVSSDITLHEVAPLTGTTAITTGDQGVELVYSLFDQHGEEMTFHAHEANKMGDEDVEIIEGVEFTSSNPEVIDIDTLTINEDGVATLNVGTTAGTTEIIATIPETNVVSKVSVTVAEYDNVAPEITGTTMYRGSGSKNLFVGFKLNEHIDLSAKSKGNVEIIYQTKQENGEYKTNEQKNKLYAGYLNSSNEAKETIKYGPGMFGENYESILPVNQTISTTIKNKNWISNELRVIIRVTDNNGNKSEQIMTLPAL